MDIKELESTKYDALLLKVQRGIKGAAQQYWDALCDGERAHTLPKHHNDRLALIRERLKKPRRSIKSAVDAGKRGKPISEDVVRGEKRMAALAFTYNKLTRERHPLTLISREISAFSKAADKFNATKNDLQWGFTSFTATESNVRKAWEKHGEQTKRDFEKLVAGTAE